MKIKQKTLKCITKRLQGINTMGLGDPWANTYLQICKLEELEEMP